MQDQEAAKVALLERMAAFSQKAELNQACLSVLFCSEFGQERPFIFEQVDQSTIEIAAFRGHLGVPGHH
jgi:hypothetical protein